MCGLVHCPVIVVTSFEKKSNVNHDNLRIPDL